ncbi:MAG TPA: hypothetical protein VIV40_33975 [Kofleriaceae bacterium]
MTRATWAFFATSVAGIALAIWLYLDNRALSEQLVQARAVKPAAAATEKVAAARSADPSTEPSRSAPSRTGSGPLPSLPDAKDESRLERRQRRQQEFAAMFGRLDGETEEEYKNRIVPLIKAGLLIPRQRADEMRKQAEEKAGVTAEQSKKLDQAFDKVYAETLDYTNKAIADGMLSPYERNVSGWLEYAGGLGGVLNDANGQIGKILTPQQMKTMSQSGFEWGEYLGLNAPWEQLQPPPPPPK